MGSTTKKGNTANPGLSRASEVPPPSFVVVAGPFELTVHGAATGNLYLGWTPTECTLRITNNPQPNLNVILKNRDVSSGRGQVDFRTTYTSTDQDTLALTLPGDGSPVTFFVGGKFGSPSFHDQDGAISIHDAATNVALHQRTVMVRVRKNANTMTIAERDRFIYAYAALNASSLAYQVYLDMHNGDAHLEIHMRPSFLPWHRAFLLDIERELQLIDASVTIPYWKFDEPAPNVFHADFIGGTPNSAGRVSFSGTNPLRIWTISGTPGVIREASFNIATGRPALINQTATLAPLTYESFDDMENDPHDLAHDSFTTGRIRSPSTATQDPLFFLLHSNIDRLWANWQFEGQSLPGVNRWNALDSNSYSPDGSSVPGDPVTDTMWPWNGVTGGDRPPTAPGGTFPPSTVTSMPGVQPRVQDVIDYIGRTQGNTNHFDFDDVPFI